MRSAAIAVALVAIFATAGARDLQQAPAPAPSSGQPVADLLFILSASEATFPDANTLQLSGVSPMVQFYGSSAKAGLLSTANFTNSSSGADYVDSNGEWLSIPDAALFTLGQNSNKAIILQLSQPSYTPKSQSITFAISVVAPEEGALRTSRGVTNELVMEHTNNVGTPLVTSVQPGAIWNNVALFIDENQESLSPMAETKSWWWWGGPGWGWGRGYGWNRGWGWGWGR